MQLFFSGLPEIEEGISNYVSQGGWGKHDKISKYLPEIDYVKKLIIIKRYIPISLQEAGDMDLEEFEVMYSVCLGLSIKEERESQKQMSSVKSGGMVR